jgi:hypothetical protein
MEMAYNQAEFSPNDDGRQKAHKAPTRKAMEIGPQNANNGGNTNKIQLEKKGKDKTNGRYGPQVIQKRHSNETNIILTINKILLY